MVSYSPYLMVSHVSPYRSMDNLYETDAGRGKGNDIWKEQGQIAL